MINVKRKVVTKTTALLMSLLLLISLIPVGVISVLADTPVEYGVLSAITPNGIVTDANGANATATYSNITLEWDAADANVGRMQDGWWVGVQINAPADMLTEEDFADVTYQRCTSTANDTWTDSMSFWNAQDSDKSTASTNRFLTMWGIVNEQYLNDAIASGKDLGFSWRFDWNADGTYEQKVTLNIEPEDIKLNKDGAQVYPVSGSDALAGVTGITDGVSVANNKGNLVTVTNSSTIQINWSAADTSIGRNSDGWWVGVDVIFPEDVDLSKAKYQNKSSSGWGEVKSVDTYKDSANNIQLWGLMNETYLKNAADNSKNLNYMWRFDWNGDGVYEQQVHIKINPDKVVLKNAEGEQAYPIPLTTNIGDIDFVINEEAKFTYTTKAGMYKDTPVLGRFNVSDENGADAKDCIAKLEYFDVTANDYREFYGDFGPAETGFPFADATSQFCVTFKKPGKYVVTAQMIEFGTDNAICENVTTIEVKDVNAPEISSVTGNATDWTKNDVVLTVTAADDSGEVAKYRYEGGEWQTSNVFTIKENGSYVFYAKDASGNVSEAFAAVVVDKIDKEAPAVDPIVLDPDDWTKNTVKVTVTASDDGAGEIEYKIDSGDWQTANTFDINDNREHTIYAKDALGNTTDGIVFRADKYDDEAPVINSVTPDTTEWVSEKVIITVDAEDSGSQGISYRLGENGEWEPDNTIEITENGEYKVYVRDALENVIAEPFVITIDNIDKTAPVITDFVSTTEELTNSDVAISGTVTDSQSGVQKLEYKIGDGEWQSLDFDEEGKFAITVTGDCNTEYTFKCTDNVAWESVESSKAVIIDKTVPVIDSVTASTTEWTNSNITLTVSAHDAEVNGYSSGIKELKCSYDNGKVVDGKYIAENKYTIEIPADNFAGTVTVWCVDEAGNISENSTINLQMDINKPMVVDAKASNAEWTNESVTISGKVIDELVNDAKSGVVAVKCSYGSVVDEDVKFDAVDGSFEITIPAQDYNGNVSIWCIDAAGNKSEVEDVAVKMDVTSPNEVTITYSEKVTDKILNALTFGFYKEPVTVRIEAKDNLNLYKIIYSVNGTKALYDNEAVVYEESAIVTPTDKNNKGEVFAGYVEFKIEPQFKGLVKAIAYDHANNFAEQGENTNGYDEIIVDNIAPKINIAYEAIDAENTLVSFADKNNNPLKTFTDSECTQAYYNGAVKATITIDEANFFEGQKLTDENGTTTVHQVGILVAATDSDGKTTYTEYVPEGVTEGTFAETQKLETVRWNSEKTVHTFVIELKDDADYVVTVKCAHDFDLSGNGETITANDTEAATEDSYTSKIITVDTVAPVIAVEYDNVKPNGNCEGIDYYGSNRTATITVEEHNFFAKEMKVDVTADDGKDNAVAVEDYAATAQGDKWTTTENTHKINLDYTVDANYTFDVNYTDLAGNAAIFKVNGEEVKDYPVDAFVLDKTAPSPDSVTITYSEKITDKILNALTFGFYKAPVTVTIKAEDNLNLYKIIYSVNGTKALYDNEAVVYEQSAIVMPTDKNGKGQIFAGYVEFEIEPQFKGLVKAIAYDHAGNGTKQDKNTNGYDEIIVDNIAPTMSVLYSQADRIVDAGSLEDKTATSIKDEIIAYYNGDATVTFTVTENNFYVEDVKFVVTRDGVQYTDEELATLISWGESKGNVHTATLKLEDEGDYFFTVNYTDRSANVMNEYVSHQITIDREAPVIDVKYDKATNVVMKDNAGNDREYFDIEKRTAIITITEHNFRADDVVVTVYAKNSSDENITPVGNITFDKDSGIVNQYFNDGCDRTKWTAYEEGVWSRADDTYTLKLEYTEEANYTFDVEYVDLATNAAADYETDYFTIDRTAPDCKTIRYSETVERNVFEEILNVLSFGTLFYNDQMTVTITAYDEVSGVNAFDYSYIVGEGVSNVNKSGSGKITNGIGQDETIFTAKFNVPSEALTRENQFNGKINFTAYDRSNNKSGEAKGETTVVVDNIAPTVNITYTDNYINEVEHNEIGKVTYYDGNFETTIEINEANFYLDDVIITVTKDNESYSIEDIISWSHSGDVHIAKFTLTEEGDYVIEVKYKDRSENLMDCSFVDGKISEGTEEGYGAYRLYTSNQRTIDTVDPVINVSGIKHQSANNGDTIGFTISVTDYNIGADFFKPRLIAVTKVDDGDDDDSTYAFRNEEISLGEVQSTENAEGQTVLSYTVNNLDKDGYYILTCSAEDYAKHLVNIIDCDGVKVETVNFSVNRKGSVFWIETEHTNASGEIVKNALDGAYVNGDVVIRLHEINVDRVDENADKRTVFTLNDGSSSQDIINKLTDIDKYSKNVMKGSGGWYECIYTLDKAVFDHDGVYSFNIITYDKADNSNINTKFEKGTISFVLDRTKPVVSTNIKSNKEINSSEFWVEFTLTDANLDPETIVVKLIDRKGNIIETTVEDLGNNEYRFLVGAGYNYTIEITAKDLAGNIAEIYKADHFTVSDNIFILWYANEKLFWGSIGGVVLLAALIIFIILFKKKKKAKEE